MVLEKKKFNAATCRQNDHMAYIDWTIEVEDVKMKYKKGGKKNKRGELWIGMMTLPFNS